ncbi:hypothetical protein E0I26_00995 [Flavobacterium rhamnosiphilum]|uniref:Lipoprotein n=1 Tax=Flavobacterium rhamnosiphilum TaxID=2541724 RepID=A0A4R5FCM8_9FLAO|nr:hypothetical protein [Flavobacterium rhamnosiphilum]TDE46690.1 hypothetical protein E0I26_00995 [Flavobacterium rhamnosiphilum]
MKGYKTVVFLFIIAISLTFCAMKQDSSPDKYREELAKQVQTDFPQEIKSVYFQKWIGGREETGSGINFYIEFKKPLSGNIKLKKIYFHNQESSLEEVTKNTFVAHFYQRNKSFDLIMDKDSLKEYGNKAPIIVKPKFALKPNEALLEYKKKGKTQFFKISNPKERPMIAYPSMNKPKD